MTIVRKAASAIANGGRSCQRPRALDYGKNQNNNCMKPVAEPVREA